MPTPTDVANRALQRCGAQRIADGALLTEDSRNAAELRSMYDSLRRAEFRRNVWRFSIRNALLYPMATDGQLVAFGVWSSATAYAAGDIVTGSDGYQYQSLLAANLNNSPLTNFIYWERYFGALSANLHVANQSYYVGDLVYVSTTLYRSKTNGNATTPPGANWQTMTTAPTLTLPVFLDRTDRYRYRLPASYMRAALQDDKDGAVQSYGGPIGYPNNDWLYEGDYLLSSDIGPIWFRFAADVVDPNKWDPLFVEGFSSRLAYEAIEILTQSNAKKQTLAGDYQKFMSEARIVNGIERGPIETPIEPLIEARL